MTPPRTSPTPRRPRSTRYVSHDEPTARATRDLTPTRAPETSLDRCISAAAPVAGRCTAERRCFSVTDFRKPRDDDAKLRRAPIVDGLSPRPNVPHVCFCHQPAAEEEDDDDGFKVHTKSAADANPLAKEYEDITLNCRDCNAEFIFSAGEQEFYQSKGWENQPTRCTECKNAKKARFGEGPSAGPVCYAFQKGECTRGDACRVSHTEGGGGGGGFGGGGGGAPVCYAFQKGECTRGDACRFSHTEGGGGGGGGFGARSAAPCYAFQKGECSRGDSCRFSHDPNAEAPQRSSQPCYAFQKGECTRGDSCRFSHD